MIGKDTPSYDLPRSPLPRAWVNKVFAPLQTHSESIDTRDRHTMCSDAHCISSHIVRRRAAFRAQNSSGIHRYGPRCALLNANPRGQAGRKEEAREAHLIAPTRT